MVILHMAQHKIKYRLLLIFKILIKYIYTPRVEDPRKPSEALCADLECTLEDYTLYFGFILNPDIL